MLVWDPMGPAFFIIRFWVLWRHSDPLHCGPFRPPTHPWAPCRGPRDTGAPKGSKKPEKAISKSMQKMLPKKETKCIPKAFQSDAKTDARLIDL